MKTLYEILSLPALALLLGACSQPKAQINIDAAQRGAEVPSSLYGIFFEEINHAGDGGLYAELIQNRGFEDTSVPEGYWVEGDKIYPPAVCNHLTGSKPHPDRHFAGQRTKYPHGRSNSWQAKARPCNSRPNIRSTARLRQR